MQYLAKHGNTKIASFSLKCGITALPEFNQLLLDFFTYVNLKLILLLIQTPWISYLMKFSSGLLGPIAQEKWSWEVLRSSCWTVLRTPCTGACMSCVAERQIIMLSTKRLITANICWDSKIFHQYCPLTFYLRLDKEQLPLLTQQSTSPQTWWTMSVW